MEMKLNEGEKGKNEINSKIGDFQFFVNLLKVQYKSACSLLSSFQIQVHSPRSSLRVYHHPLVQRILYNNLV
jgi:hypothetical protein